MRKSSSPLFCPVRGIVRGNAQATGELARARSWLIATPLVSAGSSVTTVVLLLLPLLARLLVAAAALLLVSLGAAVTVDDALQLSALIAAGGGAGALCGAWLSRRTTVRRHAGSRYAPRPISAARSMPSSAALSRWPIAQAFAWSRPENARLLLAARSSAFRCGTGILAGLFIIATWLAGSYLVALLISLTRVARCASEWLRSTPIAFWAFAWPLARRVLLHQLCGTVRRDGILSMLGAPPSTAIYFGTVWMTLVVLVAALSLADCYRAQSPTVKTVLSMMAALVAEERAHGWGLSLAVALAALHLRIGAKHART